MASSYRNRKNVYTCEVCCRQTVTIDVDDGVTPFMIRCRAKGCRGSAVSSFYRCDPALVPTHEWYKPIGDELARLDPDALGHVQKGGLLLREVPSSNRAGFVVRDMAPRG